MRSSDKELISAYIFIDILVQIPISIYILIKLYMSSYFRLIMALEPVDTIYSIDRLARNIDGFHPTTAYSLLKRGHPTKRGTEPE